MGPFVREPAVAGSWYSDDPRRLADDVERHLAAVPTPALAGGLVGLISPHAGLRYSGPVAAWGYALLRQHRPATIVLVGPAHRVAFRGVSVWPRGAWRTPLGEAAVDEALARRLLASGRGFSDDTRPHLQEHSLEMQLPFLRHLAPQARIVPALMGTQDREAVDTLAAALAEVAAEALLVASSDLSHYHASQEAARLDAVVIERVRALDPDGLMGVLERNHQHACGGGPMVAVMKAAAALGADSAQVLRYADSGDVAEGDKGRVVGYLSAALLRTA